MPRFDPGAAAVPPCVLTNVSTVVSSGAFSPFILPLPVRGSDRRGNPLLLELARDAGNSSRVAVQAWSGLSGKLVYNQTFACGSPSYLYSCPPTNQPAPDGLNGAYLVRGTLLFGGGPWSQQNYFMAALPALAEEEEEAGEEAATGGGNGGIAGNDGDVPVLTFVNASSAQGSWLASGSASLFVAGAAPGGWPLKVQ